MLPRLARAPARATPAGLTRDPPPPAQRLGEHRARRIALLRHRRRAAAGRLAHLTDLGLGQEDDVLGDLAAHPCGRRQCGSEGRDADAVRVPGKHGDGDSRSVATSSTTRRPRSPNAASVPAAPPSCIGTPRGRAPARPWHRAAPRASPRPPARKSSAPPAGAAFAPQPASRGVSARARRSRAGPLELVAHQRDRIACHEHRRRIEDVLARRPQVDIALVLRTGGRAEARTSGSTGFATDRPRSSSSSQSNSVAAQSSTIVSDDRCGTRPTSAPARASALSKRRNDRSHASPDTDSLMACGTKSASNAVIGEERRLVLALEDDVESQPVAMRASDERFPGLVVQAAQDRVGRIRLHLVGKVHPGHESLQQPAREHAEDQVRRLEATFGPGHASWLSGDELEASVRRGRGPSKGAARVVAGDICLPARPSRRPPARRPHRARDRRSARRRVRPTPRVSRRRAPERARSRDKVRPSETASVPPSHSSWGSSSGVASRLPSTMSKR